MYRFLRTAIVLPLLALMCFTACDDNTADIGIYPTTDGLTNSTGIFSLTTRSIPLDSVVAYSMTNYLGSITDPETGTDITADFAAQFYTFEDYRFPDLSLLVGEDEEGNTKRGIAQCDSIELRLYFDNYYGDDNNPMKLEVYELSAEKMLNEDSVYYTDLDLSQFLPQDARPLTSRVFTPKDYNVNEATQNTMGYSKNVRIVLPQSLGQHIMEKYVENKDYFRDSYHFIRNVFPGLYFRTSNGQGTMLSVYVGTINLYYRYGDKEEPDTVYSGITRFASTPEVIQTTRFNNEDMALLLQDSTWTYLKTPAGICTEMTLPIDTLFAGAHATDSISMASITFTRYNKPQDKYQLNTPGELLMVRKQDMRSFFLEHRVADNRTSYTTSFDKNYNTYTFNNICRLIAYCKHEKMEEVRKAQEEDPTMTEERWMEEHPDWDKVVLIPVVTSSNTNGSQVSVTHDLGLNSIRLVGGKTPLKMQVIYSKFYQEP